ncbi:hypothetical protein EVAR_27012_1 [Eumeta japonica]|uniref:Uncharacterized protein n=1 Tax=Eumeta variegata TaxID=151549 RepID=A0A4C1Z276_EUMVA|nr:hypothetical protein EVAR_27012_1 [Eumeta japonica]
MIDDGNEREITMDDILKALKRMKVGKTAGYDRDSSEMVRGDEGILGSYYRDSKKGREMCRRKVNGGSNTCSDAAFDAGNVKFT